MQLFIVFVLLFKFNYKILLQQQHYQIIFPNFQSKGTIVERLMRIKSFVSTEGPDSFDTRFFCNPKIISFWIIWDQLVLGPSFLSDKKVLYLSSCLKPLMSWWVRIFIDISIFLCYIFYQMFSIYFLTALLTTMTLQH